MAYHLVCPTFTANPKVIGHGTAEGYSEGGALSHGTRCAAMGDILRGKGIGVVTAVAGNRGAQTEDEFFARALAKMSAQSAPATDAAAAETIVIDGKVYRAQ